MKHAAPYSQATLQGLLVLLCLLLFIPGQTSLPPFDRDEARFAQATKQMLESGDYVDIRFQDRSRHRKPAGIHWLQALSVRLAGPGRYDAIWSYRIPSLLGATLAVLLTFRVGALLFQPATGLLGAVLMAFTLMLNVEARMAKTDAVLLACVVAAHYLLALAYLHRGHPWHPTPGQWLLGWLALAAGVLVKGPAVLVFAGLTVLAASAGLRTWRWLVPLRPLPGATLTLVLTLPWLVAIQWRSEGRFLADSLGGDVLAKLLSGQESHGAPPGTHFAILWAAFWPGSLLLSLAVPWVWRRRRHPGVLFCLAWVLPAWLLFELVPTKLPHYLLPVYPALALLAARSWLSAATYGPLGYRRLARWAWLVAGTLPPVLMIAAYLYLRPHAAEDPHSMLGLGGAAAAMAGVLVFAARSRSAPSLGLLLAGVLVFYGTAFHWLLPAMQPLWPSREVAAVVARLESDSCPRIQLMSVDYAEPSLVFLVGTDTVLATVQGRRAAELVQEFLQPKTCRAALVPAEIAERLLRSQRYGALWHFRGINYSKGRILDLQLVAHIRLRNVHAFQARSLR